MRPFTIALAWVLCCLVTSVSRPLGSIEASSSDGRMIGPARQPVLDTQFWWTAPALIGSAVLGGGIEDLPTVPHVRGLNAQAQRLIARATRRSETVARLLGQLALTDVIVYVDLDPYLAIPTSMIQLLGGSPSGRFLLVRLNARTSDTERIVLLGHELQHASEVDAALEVRDVRTMRALYERIGERLGCAGQERFETGAAQATSRRVLNELFSGSASEAARLADRLAYAGYLSETQNQRLPPGAKR